MRLETSTFPRPRCGIPGRVRGARRADRLNKTGGLPMSDGWWNDALDAYERPTWEDQ